MLEPPRRPQQLSVALPASFTKDIPHLREKTNRTGIVARALAIFRVDRAIIYNDNRAGQHAGEGRLFQKLLSYLETPQYLRKTLFSHDPDLQFAGILPPLRLPSHPSIEKPRIGMIRESVVVRADSSAFVDAGLPVPVRVASKLKPFERVTIRLTQVAPHLEAELVDRTRLPIYWGFSVTRTELTLGQLIRGETQDMTISTSRKGRDVREALGNLGPRWKSSKQVMLLFGSPDRGVPEILSSEGLDVGKVCDFNLNTIPHQGVETVRTEEALIATLSVLNVVEER